MTELSDAPWLANAYEAADAGNVFGRGREQQHLFSRSRIFDSSSRWSLSRTIVTEELYAFMDNWVCGSCKDIALFLSG